MAEPQEDAGPQDAPPPRLITTVTAEELAQVDLEAPIQACQSFEPHDLANNYRTASTSAPQHRNEEASLVYALFQGILDLHFKPQDRAEPFGAMFVSAQGRSMMLSDIPKSLADALAAVAPDFRHPVLRARIADVAWCVNRRNGACAPLAIAAYCDSVEELRAGRLEHGYDDGDPTDRDAMERLRRAFQIAAVTKGKEPFPERLVRLTQEAREDARSRGYLYGFSEAAELELDFAVADPAAIAAEAESLVAGIAPTPDGHWPLHLLELSARAWRQAGDKDNETRLAIKAAEWCVGCAETFDMAMMEAHWLTRAIGLYGCIRSEKARRNELRKRLIDVQARSLDDLVPISNAIPIGDIVERVHERVSGRPLGAALRYLMSVSRSPSPQKLREEALALARRTPLSSLGSTQVLDGEGKVAFLSSGIGLGAGVDEDALRFKIMQNEALRRQLLTESTLDRARAVISAEHAISASLLMPLMQATPLVPPGHEFVFAQGFARWFGGDVVSAVSILVPQLEASLRYLLKSIGEDVSTMKTDGTQEDRSIHTMIEQMRDPVTRVLGEEFVYEIENLFLLRAGPGVRNNLAHGVFSTGHFYSADANYACWFIFQLCFLPLLQDWTQVEKYLDAI